jgi:hypothetical protein
MKSLYYEITVLFVKWTEMENSETVLLAVFCKTTANLNLIIVDVESGLIVILSVRQRTWILMTIVDAGRKQINASFHDFLSACGKDFRQRFNADAVILLNDDGQQWLRGRIESTKKNMVYGTLRRWL